MPSITVVNIQLCGNNKLKEKTGAEKTNDAGTVNQVVGIGKIEPESDIVQLSSTVNGIVQKILKKENDSVNEGTPILELEHQLEDGKVKQLVTEVILRPTK